MRPKDHQQQYSAVSILQTQEPPSHPSEHAVDFLSSDPAPPPHLLFIHPLPSLKTLLAAVLPRVLHSITSCSVNIFIQIHHPPSHQTYINSWTPTHTILYTNTSSLHCSLPLPCFQCTGIPLCTQVPWAAPSSPIMEIWMTHSLRLGLLQMRLFSYRLSTFRLCHHEHLQMYPLAGHSCRVVPNRSLLRLLMG